MREREEGRRGREEGKGGGRGREEGGEGERGRGRGERRGRGKQREKIRREDKKVDQECGYDLLVVVLLIFCQWWQLGFSGITFELTVCSKEGFNAFSFLPQICAVLAAVSEVQ